MTECDFCGAKHLGPNEPGMCVKHWQGMYDEAKATLRRIERVIHDPALTELQALGTLVGILDGTE